MPPAPNRDRRLAAADAAECRAAAAAQEAAAAAPAVQREAARPARTIPPRPDASPHASAPQESGSGVASATDVVAGAPQRN